ncbi:serine/threonine-protein phosphatase 6 regulatory ankyrin repeat subunit B-like [Oscarella lobularis]|uniref:serine/threonine-protein phosphatase 6 regulatory ankyrin repeat subunit B-like n=1 Tax=Oscarella lobularis TaxID=121494 RepID=UPI0033144D83
MASCCWQFCLKRKRKSDATSSIRSAIQRLTTILENRKVIELDCFLSKEDGFRREQLDPNLSVIHYVAGRQFNSEKEVKEWLGYLAVNRDESINKPAGRQEVRPLHCACKWGDALGVRWLVRHGANVNVQDRNGLTPYSLACSSSVERNLKMTILEEHGCTLMPIDIVLAGSAQFSSYADADRVFDHLVNEKGLRVNAVDEKENTPLHLACLVGSIFGVKWLVEHSSPFNICNWNGTTPFMAACKSSKNRLAKVRYLNAKGADCQSKDRTKGRTALFYAIFDSKCGDVEEVLQYLVDEKNLDINAVDEDGMTPLLAACDICPSFVVIQQLIALGADVSVRDQRGQNALHLAAKTTNEMKIIDLLIKNGVDVTCSDEDGSVPYQLAIDDEIKAFLLQHYNAIESNLALLPNQVAPD